MSKSIGLGAFIGSSYVAARNLPAHVRNLYGAEQYPGMLGAVAIAGRHNPQRPPRAGPQDCDGTSRATTESDDQVKPSWPNGA